MLFFQTSDQADKTFASDYNFPYKVNDQMHKPKLYSLRVSPHHCSSGPLLSGCLWHLDIETASFRSRRRERQARNEKWNHCWTLVRSPWILRTSVFVSCLPHILLSLFLQHYELLLPVVDLSLLLPLLQGDCQNLYFQKTLWARCPR